MASLKMKGDLAELMVATDLLRRGYKVAFPYGEDWDYDLIAADGSQFHHVQVKHATSDGDVIRVECRSNSLTRGKVKRIKRYTAKMMDWLAVYDRTSSCCYYIPATELGNGRDAVLLRLQPTKNGQRTGIHFAEDYLDPPETPLSLDLTDMEPAGFEPATSSVQGKRSPN
jgi:Holliday junction resolvase-like predicted endonuclease